MPQPGGLGDAAAAVIRYPLRWGVAGDAGCDPVVAAERGWFVGARECALHLAGLGEGAVSTAWAFGEKWPVVVAAGRFAAPALPCVVGPADGVGPDAAYARRGSAVVREAAGREEVFLTTEVAESPPGRRFDLLWFGDNERYTVREGTLEVEDLFARLTLPVERRILERLLVRGRRLDGRILDGLACDPAEAPATITVHRPVALFPDGRWREPERFFLARADFQRVERSAGQIVAHGISGARTAFSCDHIDEGWRAAVLEGDSPITGFSIRQCGETLSLTATLHPSVDPLAPGMRGRLAFDLRADLVALS